MSKAIERVHLHEGVEKTLGYSQIVKAGGFLYLSGVTSLQADGSVAHAGDVAGQLRYTYETLAELLKAQGLGMDRVVEEVVFTRDMDTLLQHLDIRKSFYPGEKYPAATAVEVTKFAVPDLLIEIKIVAFAD